MSVAVSVLAMGCGSTVFAPTLPETPAAMATPLSAVDVVPEARAVDNVERIAHSCAERGPACASYYIDDPYPDLQVPAAQRYFPTSLPQEVRSLGFQLRFDWGGDELEIERGNTLTYNFDEDP